METAPLFEQSALGRDDLAKTARPKSQCRTSSMRQTPKAGISRKNQKPPTHSTRPRKVRRSQREWSTREETTDQ
jgi:hypothetical protein